MARVGIFGGTFNPVHIGHLLVASHVCEELGLDRLLMMPCCVPPHKAASPLAPFDDRRRMLELAVAGDDRMEVSTIEADRGGVSYAVDTLRACRRLLPGADLHFVIGMDSLRELHQWRDVETLLTLCTFVTVERPGIDRPVSAAELQLPEPWAERTLAGILAGRRCDVSSSEVRRRVAHGQPIRYLVPQDVEAYIRRRGLYLRPAHEENRPSTHSNLP